MWLLQKLGFQYSDCTETGLFNNLTLGRGGGQTWQINMHWGKWQESHNRLVLPSKRMCNIEWNLKEMLFTIFGLEIILSLRLLQSVLHLGKSICLTGKSKSGMRATMMFNVAAMLSRHIKQKNGHLFQIIMSSPFLSCVEISMGKRSCGACVIL